ncbi:hypothetical protein Rsub_07951 [Raphidocelis subcapitata]|uniref:HP domain-containing protein n=1 Tax=Raphidocelis subcapitata TaxID=307507 RepID=A0A2V0P5W7_9CHLO|nr:hypothetical protein Rsub_07951 [Raphidocelis subcapitata]|eukprot:GBF95236.1 hypothetical protein Rsub_07951 [Raphidocelis subcapitata]
MSTAEAEKKVGELNGAANGAGDSPLETQGSTSSLKGQPSAGSDPAGLETPSKKKKNKKGRKSLDKASEDHVPAAEGGASALASAASADHGALAEVEPAAAAKSGGGADEAGEQQHKQQHGAAAAAAAAAAAGSRSATDMANPLGASRGSLLAATAQINPDAELVRASDPLDEVRAASLSVTDLSKQLKEQFATASTGGSGEGARDSTAGGVVRRDSTGNMASLTQHDLVNTANVALVLQAGEFKMKPGVDFVPYAQLQELRLEDGLDVSRKEEYLSDAEFETVFGMDKADFKAMPAWKRINAKKSKGLF